MRIGLLGVASITHEAIVEPSAKHPSAILQGIAARDLARAEAYANKHSIVTAFSNYDSLVTCPDIDLVYNALPISLHAHWTLKALEAGKHVLCEKPLAMNTSQVQMMLEAAKRNNVRLIEAFHHYYHPLFQSFIELVKSDQLGTVVNIRSHFCVGIADDGVDIRYRPTLGGGAMMDLGCYPLTWALSLTDSPIKFLRSTAAMTPSGVDESMSVDVIFDNGVEANLHASMQQDSTFDAAITVTGTEGKAEFKNPLSPHTNGRLIVERDGEQTETIADKGTTYAYQLAGVIEALKKGTPLYMEGTQLLRQQKALDKIYAAAGLNHLRHFPE